MLHRTNSAALQPLTLHENGDAAAAARSHGANLHVASRAESPSVSLHIPGPSQCPRLPCPAAIARSRLAVAGCAGKSVAEVVWNGPCVVYGENWQFPQNVLYRDDTENRLPVVDLIYNPRADRPQPSCQITKNDNYHNNNNNYNNQNY